VRDRIRLRYWGKWEGEVGRRRKQQWSELAGFLPYWRSDGVLREILNDAYFDPSEKDDVSCFWRIWISLIEWFLMGMDWSLVAGEI